MELNLVPMLPFATASYAPIMSLPVFCCLENQVVVLHHYEFLPEQEKLDGFKALAKSWFSVCP